MAFLIQSWRGTLSWNFPGCTLTSGISAAAAQATTRSKWARMVLRASGSGVVRPGKVLRSPMAKFVWMAIGSTPSLAQAAEIFLPWTQGRILRNPDGIHAYKVGEWNEVQVRVEGEPARLRMWLNGSLITDFQHTAESTKGIPTQGRIALQVHPDVPNLTTWKPGNTVRYRNIRIHRLDARLTNPNQNSISP